MTITATSERAKTLRKRIAAAFGVSLLLHLALALLLAPFLAVYLIEKATEPVPKPEKKFSVQTSYKQPKQTKPEKIVPKKKLALLRPPKKIEQNRKPKPKKKQKKTAHRKLPPPQKLKRKAVVQRTNHKRPTKANFLSDHANRVEQETRARKTTVANVAPAPKPKHSQAPPKTAAVASAERPKPRPVERPQPAQPAEPLAREQTPENAGSDPVIIHKPPPPRPKTLLMPTMKNYQRMFAQRDRKVAEQSRKNHHGKRLLEHYEEITQKVQGSLQNFISEVRPGNHTSVNADEAVYASYIANIHRRIHVRWADGYLMQWDLHEPGGSPMNDPSLNTTLELVIRADDGTLEAANIVHSSGEVRFDAAALAVVYSIGRSPNPPPQIVSPNGKVYIHWNFWRDQRQCGTFGASVYIVNKDKG